MTLPTKFDLSLVEDGRAFYGLVKALFSADLKSFEKVGKGFYAHVYRLEINKSPDVVIVKCHHYPERALAEKRQLAVLRKYAIEKLPEVYFMAPYSEEFPCEALVMEFIPGINASRVDFPNQTTQDAFVESVIINLQAWHSVRNENGFGIIGEPLQTTWQAAYGTKIKEWQSLIHDAKCIDTVSPYVMGIVDKSADLVDAVFRHAHSMSSLTHSDYNAWNMMVDPSTYRLTGVIDPIDAGWADWEIDLFHLPNSRPELGMLERYLRDVDVDDAFWMRFYFYRFWDDVKHYLRMGWYKEERFAKYAQELNCYLERCL